MEPQTGKGVATELNDETHSEFYSKLETIMKDFTSEINHCQEQSNLWLERKKILQVKMTDALQQFKPLITCTVSKQLSPKKDATVSQLIRIFLEQNGPARPRDIRKFLLNQGRTTNPGVALGRLIAEGVLKNTERGVYSVS
jgi:hypothetical protein